MAEQSVMIRKPAGKIAVAIGTKQINADGLQALLQDIKLRIHNAYQDPCLVRNLSRSPDNTQDYEHRQDNHDEGQSPYAIDGHNRTKRSGTGIKEGCKENP